MNILFAASEVAPFAKTGGLADVAGSLPLALARLGHDVRIVLPRYQRVAPDRYDLHHVAAFYVPLASWKERCDVFEGRHGGRVAVYCIGKDIYFNRPELYGTRYGDYRDNAERFSFFSRAIPELCRTVGFSPHIIHCNDWQTGLVPLYLKKSYAHDPLLGTARTVLTIHNLGYQGIFGRRDLRLTGLGEEDFTPAGIEFWGNMNFLKAGIQFADAVTTVSRTYSLDIQKPEDGHGLDGVLRNRSADLYGIVNGVDYDDWDPSRDSAIAMPYDAKHLAGKDACRQALRQELALPETDAPLIGMVTRLSDQKGLDILIDALPGILAMGSPVVILGTGDDQYHRRLGDLAQSYPELLRVLLTFDDALARRIYAGSDLYLMPSRYEPCGLGQMLALRYGSVPVVRRTGGLADTVINYVPRTGRGTGFVFGEYAPGALAACIQRAIGVFRRPAAWKRIMRSGMQADFSWTRSAEEYMAVYRKVIGT
jgi:starch synthase